MLSLVHACIQNIFRWFSIECIVANEGRVSEFSQIIFLADEWAGLELHQTFKPHYQGGGISSYTKKKPSIAHYINQL